MNWQTIVGLIIIVSLVLVIIIKSIIDKKKGKSSCSCGIGMVWSRLPA